MTECIQANNTEDSAFSKEKTGGRRLVFYLPLCYNTPRLWFCERLSQGEYVL